MNTTKNVLWSPQVSKIKSFYFDFLFSDKDVFRELVLAEFSPGCTYSILVRVEFDGRFAMLGNQIGFPFNDLKDLESVNDIYDHIVGRLNELSEYYNVYNIDSIQVLFVSVNILPKLSLTNVNKIRLVNQGVSMKEIQYKYNSKFLPLTINSNYFGKIVLGEDSIKYINKINEQKNLLLKAPINVNSYDEMFLYNKYIVLNKKVADNVFVRELYDAKLGIFEGKFVDTIKNHDTFDRMYNDVVFTISNSSVALVSVTKELSIIKFDYGKLKSKREGLVSNPFIGTFDIETYVGSDGFAKVYAAGFCVDPQESVMFYLDNPDYDNVLLKCIDSMLSNKYNGYIFYVHNLNFEGVFLIHHLRVVNNLKGFEYYKIKPLFKDSSLLKLEISIETELSLNKQSSIGARKQPRDTKITLVDSSNLLKGQLRKLCQAFGLDKEESKGFFPYDFVKSNTLNYVGLTPGYEFWLGIKREEYMELIRDNWNLKEECLLYLSKDLQSLLKIMVLFNQYINRKFDVQMTNCLTISRLSLNIYLKNYLKESKIPIIKGNMYQDIKHAYYGGVTEVYKPHGKNLYYYDVNSLYPFAALNPMCGPKYTYMESHGYNLELKNLFGFFYCEIESNESYIGLLPVRTAEGLIMPLGKWSGWYFSEELKFAVEQGYKIKVIKGYDFNKEYKVFDSYVNFLYKIKSTTENKVERAVIKSLLNNLLGRFGLNIYKPLCEIVNKDKLDSLISTRKYNSFTKITDNDFLISYYPNVSKSICEQHGVDYMKVLNELKFKHEKDNEFKDVSIVISAAVTAYARIIMSKVKLDILRSGGNIYYTDTDSIVTDIPLNANLVGNGLGQFKLEYKVKEAYFISNKTYGLILEDGKFVAKNKGLIEKSLNLEDFKILYSGLNITGKKTNSITTYDKGSVVIREDMIKINHNAYVKREKVYNNKTQWIDTKPLYIDGVTLLESKKKPPWLIKWIKKCFIDFFYGLIKVITAFMIVILIGDYYNLDEINVNDSSEINNIPNSVNSSKVHHYKFNKVVPKYEPKDGKLLINEYNQKLHHKHVKCIFEDIIQELVTHNLVNSIKFNDMNSILKYSENYLIDQMISKGLKVNSQDYKEIITLVKNIKNNPEMYNFICKENSIEIMSQVDTKNVFNTKSNLKYNRVSKTYMNKYHSWIINPYEYEDPGNMVIRNKLSLLEELESLNNNYTFILDEYNNIQNDIKNTLSNIPRSIQNSPVIEEITKFEPFQSSPHINKTPYIK